MKILYAVHQFYPKWYTGTEKLVYLLATMMQKRGHRVKVITFATKEEQKKAIKKKSILIERFIHSGVPVVSYAFDNLPIDINYSLRNEKLREFAYDTIKDEKPDILHVGHPMRTGEIIFAAKELNIKYILTLTDFWLICPKYILVNSNNKLCDGPKNGSQCKINCKEIPYSLINERLNSGKEILKHASCVCAPTKSLMDIFKNEIQDINSKIIELGLIKPKTIVLNRPYKSGDKIRLMFGASFVPHKGLHILLEAVKKIRSNTFTLDVYGSGPDGPYMTKIKNLIEADGRIFYKNVFSEDQLCQIFNSVDVLIIPSIWWENSPYMMKEAMARNVPVIASDVGGLTETVKNMKNGFIFKMGDVDSLKNIIEMILDKPHILDQIRNNLQIEVSQSVEQEAFLYENIYKNCIR